MDCKEAQSLIDGYLDGELDLARNFEMEDHLHGCVLCSRNHNDRQVIRAGLKAQSVYFKAPPELQKRVQRSLRQAAKVEAAPRKLPWWWVKVAAPMAAAALVIVTIVPFLRGPSLKENLTQQVVASHIRSLMANHLADVPSSDEHTVKPWFNGKLDFSPPVADLASRGFPLVGGRLDYLNNRPVAALVYSRRKHLINLFVWPSASEADGWTKIITRQGYNIFHWTKTGMTYWAVSDLSESELQEFVRQVQD